MDRAKVFYIGLLETRLVEATVRLLADHGERWPIEYFGASTGTGVGIGTDAALS